MTVQEFIAKWRKVQLTERSSSQQHFLDLCDLLEQKKPADADPDGTYYTFERGARKMTGGSGWADVWYKGHFAWEYKGKHKDLEAAYRQLVGYREDLENPPLLVVCDTNRFEVHTNFTATAKRVYKFDLEGLADPQNLDVLRRVFTEPASLRPDQAAARITEQAAKQFQGVAEGLRVRGIDAHRAAHFLMKTIFCLFAEDIGLLPAGLFTKVLTQAKDDPTRLAKQMQSLFNAMATGEDFGADSIHRFNGGLFADSDVVELKPDEIRVLVIASSFSWQHVEPSIFGTLFERLLDPSKRAQIGAHYTSKDDILTLVEPVLMVPLRREWHDLRTKCEKLTADVVAAKTAAAKKKKLVTRDRLLQDFVERLAHVTVLDPACGSGNFLYIALHLLLDLEREVIAYAANNELSLLPQVRPTQLFGIEVNAYAQELAQVAVWIGFLQWKHHNGFTTARNPVLDPVDTIRRMDAILDLSDPDQPREPEWPAAEFIVSNPPFLGGKLLRTNLGDDYVDSMFAVWDGRVPREADLCCYWFEKARSTIEKKKVRRAGLLATQGIRGGANREVLKQIKKTGDIFFAESDREWVLDGANVHVSMVGFDDGSEQSRKLDSSSVSQINPNLTGGQVNLVEARQLRENARVAFMADTKGGAFDIPSHLATNWLPLPNPSGCPNSDVIRPWVNGRDTTQRPRDQWIIDFGCDMTIEQAARYEAPFEYVREHVKPMRDTNKRISYREKWWIHVEPRPAMRNGLARLQTFIVTPNVTKHRLFVLLDSATLPDHQLIAFCRDDHYFFGILHSRVHEVWARAHGTQVRERESGFRYTPTTCFETFPFPNTTPGQTEPIAEAARELNELREKSLNPPEWTREQALDFPGSKDGPWARYVHNADSRGIGTVRYPRRVPKDEDSAKQLAKRTLTRLYNERPTWLQQAHQRLDEAVFAAYGWEPTISDDEILAKLLELNLERSRAGQTAQE